MIFLWKVSMLKCTFTLLPRLVVISSTLWQLIGRSTIPSATSYIFPSTCPVMSLFILNLRTFLTSWPVWFEKLMNPVLFEFHPVSNMGTFVQLRRSRIEYLPSHLCTTCGLTFVSWFPGVIVLYFCISAILLAWSSPETGRRNSKWYIGHPELSRFWTHPSLLAVYTSMQFLRALSQYGSASTRFWWTHLLQTVDSLIWL